MSTSLWGLVQLTLDLRKGQFHMRRIVARQILFILGQLLMHCIATFKLPQELWGVDLTTCKKSNSIILVLCRTIRS